MITKISDYRIYENYFNVIHKLNEGLIMTHDIYESTKIMSDFISNKYGFHNIDIKDNKIELTLYEDVNSILFIEILTTINNLGYYISTMNITDNKNRIKKILIEDFKRLYLNDTDLSSFINYEIVLEPKFDTKHELKNTKIYHVTETKYLNKILKNGLISKSKNRLSYYPERIYFTYNLEDAKQYLKGKSNYYTYNQIEEPDKSNFKNIEFVILEVNTKTDIIFYEDPNFKNKGIYTYENINPEDIKILD